MVASEALRLVGRGPDALAAAEHVVRLEPNSRRSWNALAFARVGVRDLDGAVAAAKRCVELAPDDWTTHANLAMISSETNPSAPGALRSAHEAVRLAPNISEAHQILGSTLLRRKQPKPAVVSLTTALRLDPHNETARHNLALARMRTGNPAQAVVDLSDLTARAPGDGLTLNNLRVAIGNTLGQIHTAVFAGAFLVVQALRILLQESHRVGGQASDSFEGGVRIGLAAAGVLTIVVVVVLVLRTRKTLGPTLLPVFRFVLVRDRLIAAWAILDGLALIPLIVGPFLPTQAWVPTYGIGWLIVFTGVILRVIRARTMRRSGR
jgi:Flp pilus assembly protein TadD